MLMKRKELVELVVLVGRKSVLIEYSSGEPRCLLGYLLEVEEEKMPWIEVAGSVGRIPKISSYTELLKNTAFF